jgi:hypothetical protein
LTKQLDSLKNWVIKNEMKQNQIISINMNETEVYEGDSIVNVIYRNKSNDETATPCSHFDYKKYDVNMGWIDLFASAHNDFGAQDKQVLNLQHCPKSVGTKQHQVLFFTPGKTTEKVQVKDLLSTSCWSNFCKDIETFLNKFVAPHQLISISIFEDRHPNKEMIKHCVITHTAGELKEELPGHSKGDIIYKLTYVEMGYKTSWDEMYGSLCEQVNKVGAEQGFQVCFTNESPQVNGSVCYTKDAPQVCGKVGAMFSYDNNTAEKLKEQMRPVSCLDNCVLF